ncbi:MAG: OsmC family protein [Armatimonadota bacterium]|nr:OsmC family protein [Armatimonadota bacterium]
MKVDVTNSGSDYHALAASGRRTSIVIGEHRPDDDDSMNPSELLLSSVGMCIALMLRNYCESRDLDCGEIAVRLEADWNADELKWDNLPAVVEVPGEWDERRKTAFLRVAETCPVHHTLVASEGMDIEVS